MIDPVRSFRHRALRGSDRSAHPFRRPLHLRLPGRARHFAPSTAAPSTAPSSASMTSIRLCGRGSVLV